MNLTRYSSTYSIEYSTPERGVVNEFYEEFIRRHGERLEELRYTDGWEEMNFR